MEKLPRQKYTKEFREQAVRLVTEQELTIPEAARRLPMSDQTLSNWVFKARHGKLTGIDAHRKPITDLEAETSKLKRELAEARMERDILKKPSRTLPGRRCPVRAHDDPATLISTYRDVPRAGSFPEWLLRLRLAQALETRSGECTPGNGDSRRASTHARDLRP